MEIKVNIPQNDYVQPTEIREEVVQAICSAFLANNCWNIFHPFSGSNNGCRPATTRISLNQPRFNGHSNGEDMVRIHGCEMKAAFKALIKAGYHMYKVYDYGSWMGYACGKKPFREGASEVLTFNDFID